MGIACEPNLTKDFADYPIGQESKNVDWPMQC